MQKQERHEGQEGFTPSKSDRAGPTRAETALLSVRQVLDEAIIQHTEGTVDGLDGLLRQSVWKMRFILTNVADTKGVVCVSTPEDMGGV